MSDAAELDSLAVEELLREAKRGKERSSSMGAYGWKKRTMSTNKTFLKNTLRGVVGGNSRIGKSEEHRLHGTRLLQGRSRQSHRQDESESQRQSHGNIQRQSQSQRQSHSNTQSQSDREGGSPIGDQSQSHRLQNKDFSKAVESSDENEGRRSEKDKRKESFSRHSQRSSKDGWRSKEDKYQHQRSKITYEGHDTKRNFEEYDEESRRDYEQKDSQASKRVRDR